VSVFPPDVGSSRAMDVSWRLLQIIKAPNKGFDQQDSRGKAGGAEPP
jgi:hypothetical protein